MKKILLTILVLSAFACEPRQGKSVEEAPVSKSKFHEVVVKEVIQAQNYTYLKAEKDGTEIWMAVLKGNIETGKTYYYDQAMEMKNFTSKDLGRTFEQVYFLEGLYENPGDFTKVGVPSPHATQQEAATPRQEIIIPEEEGVTTIERLYQNTKNLENKTVTVKGIVTKFNLNIMNRNWVHIQDGTGGENTFDLTITTGDEVKIGEIVKFEGIVAINRDFGHGYKYDLILEEARQLDKKPDVKVN